MAADYAGLKRELESIISRERLIDDPLRTLAYGTDASFYRLIPRLVVKVISETEVVAVLEAAAQHATPVTFRAAGTSLSGQAISDSVLVLLSGEYWRDYRISEDASEIRLQPGIVGAWANNYLAPTSARSGPIRPRSTRPRSAVSPPITPAACAVARPRTATIHSPVCVWCWPMVAFWIPRTAILWPDSGTLMLICCSHSAGWLKRPGPTGNWRSVSATNTG